LLENSPDDASLQVASCKCGGPVAKQPHAKQRKDNGHH